MRGGNYMDSVVFNDDDGGGGGGSWLLDRKKIKLFIILALRHSL